MIPAVHAYGWECHLVEPADLANAVIGISAEVLAGLSPAEIAARIGPSAARKCIVVFDGPARTTPSKLDDGSSRRRIVRALVDADVPFVVAPALAAAQLAYMHAERLISHVCGSDEAWSWADVPLVLDIFASQPQMSRRSAVLAQSRSHENAFVELIAGLGSNAVTKDVFPPLATAAPPTLDMASRSALQLGGPPPPMPIPTGNANSNANSNGNNADDLKEVPPPAVSLYRATLASSDAPYLASLQRALTYIYRQPILQLDGTVRSHNLIHKESPKDSTDVIGCQSSPVIYYYLTQGSSGPESSQGMVWAKYTEAATAIVARRELSEPQLGQQFRSSQQASSPIRQQAYAVLVSTSHRYFQMKEVVVRIPGAANFSKQVQPKFPASPTSFPNGEQDKDSLTAQSLVADAVRHSQTLADLDGVSTLDMPQAFTQKHIGDSDKTPASSLVQETTLVFRQLVEVSVFWASATKSLDVDSKKVVRALPFQ